MDAIPFDIIDLNMASVELTEFLGGVLTVAVLSDPAKAAEAVEGFLDPATESLPLSEILDQIDATDDMLTNSAALIRLLAMWFDGKAEPMQPGHTLRKMILEPRGNRWQFRGLSAD